MQYKRSIRKLSVQKNNLGWRFGKKIKKKKWNLRSKES